MSRELRRYGLMLLASFIMAVGDYFFLFPNHFCYGGISGMSIIAAQILPVSASSFSAVSNLLLLVAGFIFVGRQFAMTTAFASVTISTLLVLFEQLIPLEEPLTDQLMLEFMLAVALPSLGSALLFHMGASSGGTDIPAMILKKYAHIQNVGISLFWIDFLMVTFSVFVLDFPTILYSSVGLVVKTFLIDDIIESITLCKSVMIICKDTEPIQDFIIHKLNRGATISQGRGAYTGTERSIIFTTLTRRQTSQLRAYIRQNSLQAFITMSNTIDVFGKGFSSI